MNNLEQDIKTLIIDALALEDITAEEIDTDMALFDDGLGLDSIDALELGVALKKRYQISVKGEDETELRKHFYSVATLVSFINAKKI